MKVEEETLSVQPDIERWTAQCLEWVYEIDIKISALTRDLPEDEESLWERHAMLKSQAWTDAYVLLQECKDQIDELMEPDVRPLGLVGAALDGIETSAAERKFELAREAYQEIDEQLRKDKDIWNEFMSAKDEWKTRHEHVQSWREKLHQIKIAANQINKQNQGTGVIHLPDLPSIENTVQLDNHHVTEGILDMMVSLQSLNVVDNLPQRGWLDRIFKD